MSSTVQIKEQVRAFQTTLGLQSRRELKRAILQLSAEAGDIRALCDNLARYYRLRVGPYRVIFRYLPGRIVDCVYLQERCLVYELFETEMARILGQERPPLTVATAGPQSPGTAPNRSRSCRVYPCGCGNESYRRRAYRVAASQ